MRLSAVALILLGCGPDFERPSVVHKLRILAVRSDPAAVDLETDTMVRLTPLVPDPLGGDRAATYAWSPCVSVNGTTVDVLFPSDCAVADDLAVLSEDPVLDFAVPPEVAKLSDLEDFIGQSGSFGIPVRLVVEAGDERQVAIVPVAVALSGEPNTNPDFPTLEIDGEGWDGMTTPKLSVGEQIGRAHV